MTSGWIKSAVNGLVSIMNELTIWKWKRSWLWLKDFSINSFVYGYNLIDGISNSRIFMSLCLGYMVYVYALGELQYTAWYDNDQD